jgi:hypothetical protein
MLTKLLTWLTGGATEQIGEYFRDRQKLKQELKLTELRGKAELAAAKYTALAKREENIHSWEMMQIQNSGFKDEIVLAILAFPYVGAFIPVVQDYVLIGFQYLEQMPYWAVGLTVTVFLAIYGIRHRNASKIRAPGLRDEDVDKEEK